MDEPDDDGDGLGCARGLMAAVLIEALVAAAVIVVLLAAR